MQKPNKVPFKIFWNKVEREVAKCSADELRAILRAMAQETLPTERQAFLAKLKRRQELTASVSDAQAELLADIDDWTQELQAAMKHADDGEEWRGYEYEDYYSDEDRLGPYDKFVESLEHLSERAEAAFDGGDFQLARAAYAKLLGEALQQEDGYGRGVHADDLDLDLKKTRARYLRAVYETTHPADRPRVLFEQMQQVQSWLGGARPRVNNILTISRRTLSERERFLKEWIALLRKRQGADADAWLREAIGLAEGTNGLAELARQEGRKRPHAFLDWVAALEQEGKAREVIAAAQQALETLPAKLPLRAAIADHLCAAAVKLDDAEALRAGRWEAFLVAPTLMRLLDLWDVTLEAARTERMQQAAQHVKSYLAHPPRQWDLDDVREIDDRGVVEVLHPVWIEKSVLAHAYLFGGAWEPAQQLAARERVLGWSRDDNPQGLVVSFFLVVLSGKSPRALPSQVRDLWQDMLESSVGFDAWDEEDKAVLKRLRAVYSALIPGASLSSEQQARFLAWCVSVAKRRVNAIVSEKHRGSYDKAARLTAACAQVLRLGTGGRDANALINYIRNRFPRHRAFQDELNVAVQG